jgi:hypothetical protein
MANLLKRDQIFKLMNTRYEDKIFNKLKIHPLNLIFNNSYFKLASSTSQFLRYQEEGDYKTASGGICSLLIVIVFGVLFMGTAIDTINMDIINWTSSQEFLIDPVATELTIDPKGKHFMFAVGVMGLDINNATHRYFDLEMV